MNIRCPLGFYGKIQLWPIKSRIEDAVTLFLVCLIVLTYGVHGSDMGPLGPVAPICATSAQIMLF